MYSVDASVFTGAVEFLPEWAKGFYRDGEHLLTPLVRPGRGFPLKSAVDLSYNAMLNYSLTPEGSKHLVWSDAWNTITNAKEGKEGTLEFRHVKCPHCEGKGRSFRPKDIDWAKSSGYPNGTCHMCKGHRRLGLYYLFTEYAH